MLFIPALFFSTCFLVNQVARAAPCTDDVKPVCDSFGGSLVVPEIIPEFLPTGILHLIYGDIDVGGAQQLSPERTNSAPVLWFVPSIGATPKPGPKYVLVMIDFEGKTLQWLQSDFTVDPSTHIMSSNMRANAAYLGPNPKENTGSHREVALLFTQPDSYIVPAQYANVSRTLIEGSARNYFDLATFLNSAGLAEPVGGNFFKSTWDGFVPPPLAPEPLLTTYRTSAKTTRTPSASMTATLVPTRTPSTTAAVIFATAPAAVFTSTGYGITKSICLLAIALLIVGLNAVVEMSF